MNECKGKGKGKGKGKSEAKGQDKGDGKGEKGKNAESPPRQRIKFKKEYNYHPNIPGEVCEQLEDIFYGMDCCQADVSESTAEFWLFQLMHYQNWQSSYLFSSYLFDRQYRRGEGEHCPIDHPNPSALYAQARNHSYVDRITDIFHKFKKFDNIGPL